MRRITVAIVGVGGTAARWIPLYRRLPEVKDLLVQDVNAERLNAVAQRQGVRSTTSFEEVLESDAEIVEISTPNEFHHDQTIACLKRGKHVLCQKPMGRAVGECRRMIEAAKAAGRSLGVIMTGRNSPLLNEVARMVKEGAFGRITMIQARMSHRNLVTRPREDGHWRQSLQRVGGGSFIQLGVHALHQVQWLLDSDIVRVTAFSKNVALQGKIEGDDTTVAAVEFENGAIGCVSSSYSTEGNGLSLYGTQGFYLSDGIGDFALKLEEARRGEILDYPRPGEILRKESLDPEKDADLWTEITERYDQRRAFVRAVAQELPPPVSGDLGLRDVRIIQAVYRSAELRRCVEVAEIPLD